MPGSTIAQHSLTREQVAQFLIQPLQAEAQFLAAGPRIFDANGGTAVRVPMLKVYDLAGAGTNSSAGFWRGENQLIAEAEPGTDEVRLLDGVASLKVITRYSNELARSSVVDAGRTFGAAVVRQLALELDRAFLVGDGANAPGTGTPPLRTIRGVVNQPGVQEVLAVGTPSVDDLLDAEGMALGAYASPSCWFISSRDLTTLRKTKATGTGEYLLQPDVTKPGGYTLLGYPVRVVNALRAGATSQIVLADMSQVAVGRDQAPAVTFLTERYADYDQQAIRVTTRYDLGLLNPAGVVVLRGVTA